MTNNLTAKLTIFLIWMSICFTCYAIDLEENQILTISKGIEKGSERHSDVKYCSIFLMTKRQVAEYFKRARVVTEREARVELEWSPCFVKGTMLVGNDLTEWKINAFYSGEVMQKDQLNYYYCDHCNDLFVKEPNVGIEESNHENNQGQVGHHHTLTH